MAEIIRYDSFFDVADDERFISKCKFRPRLLLREEGSDGQTVRVHCPILDKTVLIQGYVCKERSCEHNTLGSGVNS